MNSTTIWVYIFFSRTVSKFPRNSIGRPLIFCYKIATNTKTIHVNNRWAPSSTSAAVRYAWFLAMPDALVAVSALSTAAKAFFLWFFARLLAASAFALAFTALAAAFRLLAAASASCFTCFSAAATPAGRRPRDERRRPSATPPPPVERTARDRFCTRGRREPQGMAAPVQKRQWAERLN